MNTAKHVQNMYSVWRDGQKEDKMGRTSLLDHLAINMMRIKGVIATNPWTYAEHGDTSFFELSLGQRTPLCLCDVFVCSTFDTRHSFTHDFPV
jgi:hypothetical protein